jgi:hypothetical protein
MFFLSVMTFVFCFRKTCMVGFWYEFYSSKKTSKNNTHREIEIYEDMEREDKANT